VKLVEVFRFELAHRFRSPATAVYAIVLLVAAWSSATDVGPPGPVKADAPLLVAYYSALTGLFGLFVTAWVFGDAALRDIDAGMDPLLFTTSQRTIDHLAGRYLAALVANAILLLAVPVGYSLPTLLGYPDPAYFGPFRLATFLEPWAILLVPNMALAGVVLFSVAVLTRRLLPVFIAAFGLYLMFLAFTDTGVGYHPGALGTLWRLHPRSASSQGWTAAELNTRLISSLGGVLVNRVFWLAVTGGVLALLHKHFRFAYPDVGGTLPARHDASHSTPLAAPAARVVAPSFAFRTTVRQVLAIARNSLVEVTTNVWFAGVLLACAAWVAAMLSRIPGGPLDMTLWPVTMLVTNALSRDYLVLLFVLVCPFASEILWKDREVGVAEITDAAPVTDGTALLGRLLAIVGVLAIFLATSVIAAMVGQLAREYYDLEPTLYLRVVFGMNFAAGVLIALLVTTVCVVVNHKYLGLGAALLALAIPFTGPFLPHHLLTYGGDPGSAYSGVMSSAAHYSYMNGFGPFFAPFAWFKLYTAGWALLLAVVASVVWVRGRETGVGPRLRQARERFHGPLRLTAITGVALVLTTGGFILYNTNVLNTLDAHEKMAAARSSYVERYRHVADLPQPSVEHARLRVEIHPHDPAVDLSGSFRLVNRTARAIDSIHVSTDPRLTARSIAFDRAASQALVESDIGYRVYVLDPPLAPGDSTQLSFELGFRQRGFPNRGFQTDIVGNGTRVGRDWLPFVGYRGDVRREREVRVETVIGTDPEQVAIGPGALRREWTENGRRYFQYDTEVPGPFSFAVFSASYAVRTASWTDSPVRPERDVKLGIYYHPDHHRNLDTFVRAMTASLDYYIAHFGPYPSSELRIVETPRYERSARAHPGIVAFSEHAFFARVEPGQPDLVFFAIAHEVAHQWWGSRCVGAPDPSSREGYLWEMLANHSALMVTEKALGPDAARRLYAYQMDRYFTARRSGPREVPVLEMQDQPHFRRALLAMYALRQYIGEGAVNAALRRFADRHRAATSANPTVHDVYAELLAVTPDSLRYLLTDLFETATVWNTQAPRAVVEPTGTGEYRVTLDVIARKLRTDTAGTEIEVAMDDWIEIGAYSAGTAAGSREPLYLERHRIRSGEQTITFTVPREPVRVEIDPYRTLLERYGGDNIAPLRREN
jgi:hypothetical protein